MDVVVPKENKKIMRKSRKSAKKSLKKSSKKPIVCKYRRSVTKRGISRRACRPVSKGSRARKHSVECVLRKKSKRCSLRCTCNLHKRRSRRKAVVAAPAPAIAPTVAAPVPAQEPSVAPEAPEQPVLAPEPSVASEASVEANQKKQQLSLF